MPFARIVKCLESGMEFTTTVPLTVEFAPPAKPLICTCALVITLQFVEQVNVSRPETRVILVSETVFTPSVAAPVVVEPLVPAAVSPPK